MPTTRCVELKLIASSISMMDPTWTYLVICSKYSWDLVTMMNEVVEGTKINYETTERMCRVGMRLSIKEEIEY